jgi:hypothetical protein
MKLYEAVSARAVVSSSESIRETVGVTPVRRLVLRWVNRKGDAATARRIEREVL